MTKIEREARPADAHLLYHSCYICVLSHRSRAMSPIAYEIMHYPIAQANGVGHSIQVRVEAGRTNSELRTVLRRCYCGTRKPTVETPAWDKSEMFSGARASSPVTTSVHPCSPPTTSVCHGPSVVPVVFRAKRCIARLHCFSAQVF